MHLSVPEEEAAYVLTNLETGMRLAGRVRLAGDSSARRKGLLGVHSLDRESGLWIIPCEAIHTFGMKMPIDVVFLDRKYRVKKLLERLAPRRISVCLQASSVVEMRAGAITASRTKVGDRLDVRRLVDAGGTPTTEPVSLASTCPLS